jgi:hypothetical protein
MPQKRSPRRAKAHSAPSPKEATRQLLRDLCAKRAIGDGDPSVYTEDELKVLVHYGLHYLRGLLQGRGARGNYQGAEAFRRKYEIIGIFRGLPDRLKKRPSGTATIDAVLSRLEEKGIMCSERTLMRDISALGGAAFLARAKPYEPEEDRSSPFKDIENRS